MDKLNLIQPSINSIFLFLVEGWSFFYWMFSISFHIVTISCVSIYYGFFFFFREFQSMAFAPNNSFLLSGQDTNRFLV